GRARRQVRGLRAPPARRRRARAAPGDDRDPAGARFRRPRRSGQRGEGEALPPAPAHARRRGAHRGRAAARRGAAGRAPRAPPPGAGEPRVKRNLVYVGFVLLAAVLLWWVTN